MIVKSDIAGEVYVYTQALDNNGSSEYLLIENPNKVESLDTSGSIAAMVRDFIDKLHQYGRVWEVKGNTLDCRINLKGECLITLRPLTLDVSGRISPVLIAINVLALDRSCAKSTLSGLSHVVGRNLSEEDTLAISHIEKLLNLPRWKIFLNILFHSRRPSHD